MAPLTRGGAEDMHKARGQGHEKNLRPRPSTALPRTDPLEAKDRNAQGQVPRTHRGSDLQKKGLRSKITRRFVVTMVATIVKAHEP